jgi:hypothetical protein
MEGVVKPFKYADISTPDGYECGECGAKGVRLYRYYQTFLEHQKLRCRSCAVNEVGEEPQAPWSVTEHNIGHLVSAVPTEDGRTYWGYTSVPSDGVEWWNRLPKTPNV